MTARALAYRLLLTSEKNGQFSNIALDNALRASSLSDADKRLVAVLFYGVIERKLTLDYRLADISSRPLETIDAAAMTALRLGLYQLLYLDRIPDHAAINETVGLVPKKLSGFVNAILRSHLRNPETPMPTTEDMPLYLSVKYSVGLPLVKKLYDEYGEECEAILRGFEHHPKTTLRVNTLKISRNALCGKLPKAESVTSVATALYADGSVRELDGFSSGEFFVQDTASQLCTAVLEARPEMNVIDTCACPGSKSFGMAIDMQNRGRLLSCDLHENKLSLVSDGAKRLGLDIIETKAHDAREPLEELFGSADRVLCDVPCSGFGVLAKKPELRYKDPAESERLPQIQRDILQTACKYVKLGGVLVYSTCTLLKEENEENIRAFLSEHSEFELCPWHSGPFDAPEGMLTLYPHIHGTDGFFIAKLIKKDI